MRATTGAAQAACRFCRRSRSALTRQRNARSGEYAAYSSLAARAVGGAQHALSDAAHSAAARLAALEAGGLTTLSAAAAALERTLEAALPHGAGAPTPLAAPPVPRWPIFVFLAGACACLLASAVCHTFGGVSRAVNAVIWRLDYAGIAALIATSFYPVIFYSFMCHAGWRAFYLTIITACATATLVVSAAERFQTPKWRSTRAALFSALGCFGVVPILHQAFFFWRVLPELLSLALAYELLMGFLYLLGAYLYAKRIPERFLPGAFDYALHSHNLFHLLVVAAAYTHVHASMILLAWRDGQACDADAHFR
jgi:adiponectin receptor